MTGWRFRDGTPAFVDLTHVYDPVLRASAVASAERFGLALRTGVYAAFAGPSYETRAETAYLRVAGADAVGMSTVPEAVAGVALGMSVLGISVISNVAGQSSSHEEVLAAGKRAAGDLRANDVPNHCRAMERSQSSRCPAAALRPRAPLAQLGNRR